MQKISSLYKLVKVVLWFLVAFSSVACQTAIYNEPAPQHVVHQATKDLDFHWPLKDFRISRGFGAKRGRHKGLDLAAPKNTPIYATTDGIVKVVKQRARGYGKLVVVEHADKKWSSYYAHMNAMAVQQGQRIQKGELIGFVGRTGRSTGNHLHFEIRWNDRPIDPYPLLKISDENFRVTQRDLPTRVVR